MNAEELVAKLDWDSRHFGMEVAKIRKGSLTRRELQAALKYCRGESIRCLYFLADSNDTGNWISAVEAGFRPIDIRVDLDRTEPEEKIGAGEAADFATEADLPALRHLARSAFTESRFYRDSMFPTGKAEQLFALWIERGVREHESFVVVRRQAGLPAGFLSGRVSADGKGCIDLVAVSEQLRGRGIGTQLLAASLGEFGRRKCKEVSVSTQGSNVAAQRLYQAHGFRTRSVRLWFHLWLE